MYKIVSSFLSRRVVRIQAAMLGQSTWQENEGGLWETASKKQKPLFQQLTDSEYYQPPCEFGNRSFPGWISVETTALTELGGSPVWLLKMGTTFDLLWVTGIILCSFLRWLLLWPRETPDIPMHVLSCTQMSDPRDPLQISRMLSWSSSIPALFFASFFNLSRLLSLAQCQWSYQFLPGFLLLVSGFRNSPKAKESG